MKDALDTERQERSKARALGCFPVGMKGSPVHYGIPENERK